MTVPVDIEVKRDVLSFKEFRTFGGASWSHVGDAIRILARWKNMWKCFSKKRWSHRTQYVGRGVRWRKDLRLCSRQPMEMTYHAC